MIVGLHYILPIKELIKEDIKNDVFFKARQKYGDDLTCDKCEYITGEYEDDGSEFHICCDKMGSNLRFFFEMCKCVASVLLHVILTFK